MEWILQKIYYGAAHDLLIQIVLFWIASCILCRTFIKVNPWKIIKQKHIINDLAFWTTNRLIFNPLWLIVSIKLIENTPLIHSHKWPISIYVSEMSLLWQIIIGMVVYDFMAYWRHRLFHSNALWPIHAVHHSSKKLTWMSGARNHPLNTLLITLFGGVFLYVLGFSTDSIFWIGIIRLYWVNFVHMDLKLELGVFNYIIVTPRFHRWHHVPQRRGGHNYAGFFSFIDLIFGTYHMPEGEVPSKFGNGDKDYPQDFSEQLAYPLKVYLQELSTSKPGKSDKKTQNAE